jgi:hypothetical protein
MGHEYWCTDGVKSVQVVTVASKTEAEWGTKERKSILCLCMAAIMCACSFCVCSAYAQENVTGLLSRASFRSLTCPNAEIAHPNRFCASALTSTDQHLLEEIGLTEGLWHVQFSALYRCLTTGTVPWSQVQSGIRLITTHISNIY